MKQNTRQRWIHPMIFSLLLLLMAACQQGASPAAPTAVVNATVLGEDFNPQPGLITWQREPNYVLFRAEIIGSNDAFLARNTVPECTIYGDNRIVWQNNLDSSEVQILEDRLSDGTISAFVQYLTVNERVYTYTERLPEVAAQFETTPVVERVTVAVNGITHRADGLSGWDPGWFDRVLTACQTLSTAPVLVVPGSGWLSTREVAFNPQPPLILWDAGVTGISLAGFTGDTPGWVQGAGVGQLWNRIRALPVNSLYRDGDRTFQVALQVPGVTLGSPPQPTAER
ncbi:MAG: hypothetical protein IPK19_03100 [Chloroflexi bacterium]|nr:hypothetical protein [Chloroflexota bacterium]